MRRVIWKREGPRREGGGNRRDAVSDDPCGLPSYYFCQVGVLPSCVLCVSGVRDQMHSVCIRYIIFVRLAFCRLVFCGSGVRNRMHSVCMFKPDVDVCGLTITMGKGALSSPCSSPLVDSTDPVSVAHAVSNCFPICHTHNLAQNISSHLAQKRDSVPSASLPSSPSAQSVSFMRIQMDS